MSTLRAPKSVASLTVQRNNSAATSHKLDQVIISIGCKQINKHDIVVDASFISAPHCLIYYDGDQYFLIHPHPDKKYTRNGLVFKEAANNSIRQVLGTRNSNRHSIMVTNLVFAAIENRSHFISRKREVLSRLLM